MKEEKKNNLNLTKQKMIKINKIIYLTKNLKKKSNEHYFRICNLWI